MKIEVMEKNALKKITSNASAMLVGQFSLALMPLIISPYLARKFGIDVYGIWAFGLSFIQVAVIFTDYGYTISAVYKIARAESMDEVKKIVGAVYATKILLCILPVFILLIYPALHGEYRDHEVFFGLSSIAVIGITFQPMLVFNGLERMWKVTAYIVASRVLFVLLTLIFVSKPEDLEYAALFNGGTHLLAAFLGLYFVYKIGAWPKWVSIQYAFNIFKSSTEYFIAQIAVALYGAGAVIFLGTFSTPSQVATYSVAELFYRCSTAIYVPVSSSLYPHMARHRDVNIYKKVIKIVALTVLAGVTVGILCGHFLIDTIFGETYVDSYKVLVVLMFATMAAIPSMFLGFPLLGAMGDVRNCNRSVVFAACIQVAGLIILYFSGNSSAVSVAATVVLAVFCELLWRLKHARQYLHDKSL
jgi:PST family polysaccharide transporter